LSAGWDPQILTPNRVLAGTIGKLLADKYKGYDQITLPGGRERAACFAHVRRYFFDAQSAAPAAAKQAIDFILDLYLIERAVLDADILGTPEHLAMRQTSSRDVMTRFKAWLEPERDRHLPKGPMGVAIRYALDQWDELSVFLKDARVPIDNNASYAAGGIRGVMPRCQPPLSLPARRDVRLCPLARHKQGRGITPRSGRSGSRRSGGRTSSSSGTTRRARTWPASTR
jgi:transposase IS66 family protein